MLNSDQIIKFYKTKFKQRLYSKGFLSNKIITVQFFINYFNFINFEKLQINLTLYKLQTNFKIAYQFILIDINKINLNLIYNTDISIPKQINLLINYNKLMQFNKEKVNKIINSNSPNDIVNKAVIEAVYFEGGVNMVKAPTPKTPPENPTEFSNPSNSLSN